MLEVHGRHDLRFGLVHDAFVDNFARRGEVGAAVAVTLDGVPVVDLWAGHADAARTRPWGRSTLVQVYSTTKPMAALCVLMLADGGMLDLESPVARYWPEFGDHGKVPITVRDVLTHRAGLPAIRTPLPDDALTDWATMTAALAAERPWGEPRTQVAYHAVTQGFLLGEIVRRVSGRTIGQFFHDEIARPLAVDFHLGGLGPDQDHRIADVIPADPVAPDARWAAALADPESLQSKVLYNPRLRDPNRRAWRRAEIPAVNGHGTARALARIYGVLARGGTADGVRLLSSGALARATFEQVRGREIVFDLPVRWGLGFLLGDPAYPLGPNPRAFGGCGFGGSVAFADPDAGLGFAYVMNRLVDGGADVRDPRAMALIEAVYDAL